MISNNSHKKIQIKALYAIAEDLSSLDLSGVILQDNEFDYTNLMNSNLSNSHLENISFFQSNLENINLSQAKVKNCDLSQANLENANLKGVDFTSCNVKGAIFTNVKGLSREQKIWLKANGALNISLEKEEKNKQNNNDSNEYFRKQRAILN